MRWYGVLAVLVLAAGSAAPAAAQRDRGDRARPLDQILPQIRASRPGTFYDAEGPYSGPDGRLHYRLKWMTPEGRILWLDTDAHTGRILGEGQAPRRPVWDRGEDRRRYAPRNDDDDRRSREPYRSDDRQDRDNFGQDRDDRGDWNRGRDWNRGGDRSGPRTYDRDGPRDDDRGGGHDRGRGRHNW